MEIFKSKNGVSVRAYKGDAITLLAYDVTTKLAINLAGFSIFYRCKQKTNDGQYLYNRLTFPPQFVSDNHIPVSDKNSTLYSPIQKFNWVHVPNTDIDTHQAVFGNYSYIVTPRHIINGKLLPLDLYLSVEIEIPVRPFEEKGVSVAFTRGFVSSVAYANRFSRKNNAVRPKLNDSLTFDNTQIADKAKRWSSTTRKYEDVAYTFEEQHEWLGWQVRKRILEFLEEIIQDKKLSLKVFAFDLNEPEICKKLLQLAKENRLTMILDNSKGHSESDAWESIFETEFLKVSTPEKLQRGHFSALAHCKVMIQLKNGVANKILTGSANFSTNGLYVNSNHVIIFKNKKVSKLYSDIFDESSGVEQMKNFKGSQAAATDHEILKTSTSPKMTVTFAPHKKEDADRIFNRISEKIEKSDTTDLLFALMNDRSAGSILSSVRKQISNENVLTTESQIPLEKKIVISVFFFISPILKKELELLREESKIIFPNLSDLFLV